MKRVVGWLVVGSWLGAGAADPYQLMSQAVGAYSESHIAAYVADVETNGVQEHGFPRLTANIGVLLAAGRVPEKRDLFKRMMNLACRDAAKKMPPKSGGNDFSVKELVYAYQALKAAHTFSNAEMDVWRQNLTAIDGRDAYTTGRLKVGENRARNWVVFASASEQARIAAGLGGDPAFVETYVADQLRWFDANGMYKDPNQPTVYDIVTRLQFACILQDGYNGPSRARLEEQMKKSAEPTLKMLSAAGEIPFGGRSNQFLHNNTAYAALCAWYAARDRARGNVARAALFDAAAARACAALEQWLNQKPVRHVKNLYPRETGYGCEAYAYFDKYMVTMGSWLLVAARFNPQPPTLNQLPTANCQLPPSLFVTTPDFHWAFLRAGDYSAQFDWNANTHYDATGLGRLHRAGAPAALCLSSPCPGTKPRPNYKREVNGPALAIAPVLGEKWIDALQLRAQTTTAKDAVTCWRAGDLDWECRLSAEGLTMQLTGPGEVALALPAFQFDGQTETSISQTPGALTISYAGWKCQYATTNGTIVATDQITSNRNGRYRRYEARASKTLTLSVSVSR